MFLVQNFFVDYRIIEVFEIEFLKFVKTTPKKSKRKWKVKSWIQLLRQGLIQRFQIVEEKSSTWFFAS